MFCLYYFFLSLLGLLLLLSKSIGHFLDLIIAASLIEMEGSSLLIVFSLIGLSAFKAIHQFIHILYRPILNVDAARSCLTELSKVLIILSSDVFTQVSLLGRDVFSCTVTHDCMAIFEIV